MAKGEIAGLSNIFFCHYVFEKLSAAEASESVYMRVRVKLLNRIGNIVANEEIACFKQFLFLSQ